MWYNISILWEVVMNTGIKNDQIERVLQIYAKLYDGYVVNKAEEAEYYGANE